MKKLSIILPAVVAVAGVSAYFHFSSGDQTNVAQVAEPSAVADVAPVESVATNPTPAETASTSVAAAATDVAEQPAQRIELAQADFSGVEAAGFVEGRHYRRLSPTQPTSASANAVEVAEFFMYSCIHCYNLEPYVQAWLPNKPSHIEFVHVPTTWNPTVALHAQAFYAAQALGKGEEMHLPFFREMHENGNVLETPEKMAEFFGRFDVSREDFESVFDSFAIHTRVNRASELLNRYRVDSTPTIIINGKYKTSVAEAGGYDQLFELIEALAAAELGR